MKATLMLACSLALLCLATVSVTVAGEVPQLINVQGKLTDAVGDPVADGPYSVLFSIYDVVTGGTALWQETRTVTVSDGLFSISLGESTTIPPSLFDNTDLWLGIKVESDAEMAPRQRLTTAPYSFRSSGAAVGGGWVDDGSVVRLETSSDNVGIGTSTPATELEVAGCIKASAGGSGGYGLEVTGTSGTYEPSLRVNNGDQAWNIVSWSDSSLKFVKSTGSTFTPLTIKNTSFQDALVLGASGVGIGTDSATQKLEVAGTVYSTSGGFKFPDGTVQTTAAAYGGPIAYGVIDVDGSVASGTPNISSSWNGTSSRYEITISGENYFQGSYVTVVTVLSSDARMATTSSVSGNLLVFVFNSSGTAIQDNFHFVTYKP